MRKNQQPLVRVGMLFGSALIVIFNVVPSLSQQRRSRPTQGKPNQAKKVVTAEDLPDGDYEGTFLIFRKRGKTAVGSSFNGLQNICAHGTFNGNTLRYDRAVLATATYKNGDWVQTTEDRLSEYGGVSFDRYLPDKHFVGREATPDVAFGVCWKLFGPENEKAAWSTVASAEQMPDAIFSAGDNYHAMNGGIHFYQKKGTTVTGLFSAHDGVRLCYQGEVRESTIVVSRAVGFEEFNYDSGKVAKFFDVSSKDMRINHYNEFGLFRPSALTRTGDRFERLLDACAAYFGSPIASSCVPPKHRLVFVGRYGLGSGGSGSKRGKHAYVIWEEYDPASQAYRREAWGWWPKSEAGMPNNDSSSLAVVFSAEAVVRPEKTDEKNGIFVFRIPVSGATYTKTLSLKDVWRRAAQNKEKTYSLVMRDCADFVDAIAKAVGDNSSPGNGETVTAPLNIPNVGGFYTDPAEYVTALIRLNATRAAPDEVPECGTNKASSESPTNLSRGSSDKEQGSDPKKSQPSQPPSQKEKAKKALKGIWDKVKKPS